jgi:beta-lactamase superfamily II metal-dependent hydrolase
MFLVMREATELIDEIGTEQKLRDRHHRSRSDRFAAATHKGARSSSLSTLQSISPEITVI